MIWRIGAFATSAFLVVGLVLCLCLGRDLFTLGWPADSAPTHVRYALWLSSSPIWLLFATLITLPAVPAFVLKALRRPAKVWFAIYGVLATSLALLAVGLAVYVVVVSPIRTSTSRHVFSPGHIGGSLYGAAVLCAPWWFAVAVFLATWFRGERDARVGA